jgi:hypothetical protein
MSDKDKKPEEKKPGVVTASPGSEKTPAEMSVDRETAEKRHTRLGGPFTQDSVDPTETPAALKERGALTTHHGQATAGIKKYRVNEPMYRDGVYVEAGSVIAIPEEDAPPKSSDEEPDNAYQHHTFSKPLPKPKPGARPPMGTVTVQIPATAFHQVQPAPAAPDTAKDENKKHHS